MTARSDLAAILKPYLPKAWKVVPFSTNLDAIHKQTVLMLHQESIEPSAEAPMHAVQVNFKLYIIEPKTDPKSSEDSLDDSVTDLLIALRSSEQIAWTRADRAVWADTNPAYEVAIRYFATLETEPE